MVDEVRVFSSWGHNGTASSTLSHGLSSTLVTAKEKPNVALVMNVANGFYLPVLRARGVPVALNVDGIEWERDKWSSAGKRVFRAAAASTARWADCIIADSMAIAELWRTNSIGTAASSHTGGTRNPTCRDQREWCSWAWSQAGMC